MDGPLLKTAVEYGSTAGGKWLEWTQDVVGMIFRQSKVQFSLEVS